MHVGPRKLYFLILSQHTLLTNQVKEKDGHMTVIDICNIACQTAVAAPITAWDYGNRLKVYSDITCRVM